jgi:hypothetical protein
VLRNLTKDDATMQERFTVPLAALEMNSAADMINVRPVRDKPKA